jgi:hypothetical protein
VTIRPGDAVFIRTGVPAVVRDRNPTTGELKLDQDYPAVQKDFRHGYQNGLDPETRQQLYDILDSVKDQTKDPRERVDAIQARLAEIESDPTKIPLTRYLRAEMLHIMNTNGIKPKQYTANEVKTR